MTSTATSCLCGASGPTTPAWVWEEEWDKPSIPFLSKLIAFPPTRGSPSLRHLQRWRRASSPAKCLSPVHSVRGRDAVRAVACTQVRKPISSLLLALLLARSCWTLRKVCCGFIQTEIWARSTKWWTVFLGFLFLCAAAALRSHPVIIKFGTQKGGLTAYLVTPEEMIKQHYPVKGEFLFKLS